MTLMEMQNVLGETLDRIRDKTTSPEERAIIMEQAINTAKIAKQMINTADIVLRTDKLCARTDRINRMVGE